MICRYCGNKTDSKDCCVKCRKESPVLLEYKSYSNDLIIEKLSVPLKSYNEQTPDNQPVGRISVPVQNVNDSVYNSDPCRTNDANKSAEQPAAIQQGQESGKNKTKRRPLLIASVCVSVVLILGIAAYLYISMGGIMEEKNKFIDEVETSAEESERDNNLSEETSVSEESETETSQTQTVSEILPVSYAGEYYDIFNSEFEDISYRSEFRDVFGSNPLHGSKILIEETGLSYNGNVYPVIIENGVVRLNNNAVFADMGDSFIKIFNFNKITQSGSYENNDDKQNELYAFNLTLRNLDSTILCNKLEGLEYPDENKVMTYEECGICLLSICNDSENYLSWVRDIDGNIIINTRYRDNEAKESSLEGAIVANKKDYKIARITSAEGQDYYFYRRADSSYVYMIQYIRCNLEENIPQDNAAAADVLLN